MKETGDTGAFLFLDFEKAFDRLDRDFLWETMRRMNFGPEFISYCQTLYANSRTTVLINGNPSPMVDVQTGVRQGCPIAALLYILACEPMANLFRQDSDSNHRQAFSGQTLPRSSAFDKLTPDPVTRLCIQYHSTVMTHCSSVETPKMSSELSSICSSMKKQQDRK